MSPWSIPRTGPVGADEAELTLDGEVLGYVAHHGGKVEVLS